MARLLVLCALLFTLTGCWTAQRAESSVEVRRGIEAGQPTNLIIRRTEEEKETAGADVGALVQASLSGLRGDLLGALDKMKPQPVSLDPLTAKLDAITATLTKPDEAPFPTGELAGGAAAAGAALLAWLKHREAARSKADAEDAWEAKAKALAALPPEQARELLKG